MSHYKLVKHFMQTFSQDIPSDISEPNDETCKLRARLNLEEAIEICHALGVEIEAKHTRPISSIDDFLFHKVDDASLVDVLDGACDLEYVNTGMLLSFGIPEENANLAFAEVHRSNMSKMWKEEHLEEARRKYPICHIKYYGLGLHIVWHNGKIIKSPTYSKPNLEQFIQRDFSFQKVVTDAKLP